ncbi:DNRLRE domain-containing protein [Dyadobacter flavalbus]|uniref:DNRLRE domain-containing protein n=1 Tax=Dyadobacter flavalbus TaxID=2579942 RepID=A0A5M8QKY0_9BACT|nr:ELWxxDGT repeat protein [Dyadobacter flavalbus]KAA6436775.1 DNRLRE domain-containing protein [Dyadobacter flavalbus]
MKRIVLYLALFLIRMQPLLAQEFTLLKDINVAGSVNGFRIYESVAAGNTIYMIADDGFQQKGLWKSDGTAKGTVLIKEFTGFGDIQRLVSSNGLAYLVAFPDNESAAYLWRSDGTPAGTFSIGKMNYKSSGSLLSVLTNINGTLYFPGVSGLMKTVGTAQGTVLVKRYNSSDEWIQQMVNANGRLFFISSNTYTSKIYKSNGTEAGTMAIEDNLTSGYALPLMPLGNEVYFAGSVNENIGLLKASETSAAILVKILPGGFVNPTPVGNSLYFLTYDELTGTELWKTDGSTAGTVLVKDINPGQGSSDASRMRPVNGELYFMADDGTHGPELWKSGGTAATTMLVKDIRPGSMGSDIKELAAVGNKAAFTANDGTGEKLWQSDGSANGTTVLADMPASRLLNVNGTLYFNGNPESGSELFKSTMVTGGTSAVTNFAKPGSMPLGFTQINGVSYFSADDGINGRELWKTDGSTAGTMLVSDILSGANGSNPQKITNVNGTAFFVTGSGSQVHSLWKTGGTAATTTKVKDFTKAYELQGLISLNGTLFFGVHSADGSMQFWKSDGSPAGTQLIRTFPITDTFSPVIFNGHLYFGAYDNINNIGLWKSDGTPEGTTLVKDMPVNAGSSVYKTITVAGNFIYYIATDYENLRSHFYLVKTDGTAQGTTVIKELDAAFFFTKLVAVNNLVFFRARDQSDREDVFEENLWRSDGTAQGTYSVATIRSFPGEEEIGFGNMIAVNGLFYFAHDGEGEIWKSDGTTAGTQRVTNFGSMRSEGYFEYLTAIGNTLYYVTSDGKSGREIWKTDLATQTTSLVNDLTPNGSTLFYELGTLNNQLLISADNGMYGAELFQYRDVAVPAAVTTIRINAGGPAFTTATKKLFIADQYYAGIDRTSSIASGDILNTTNDVLYRTARCSPSFSYNIPVANGKVDVYLHFAETYFGAPGKKGGAGSRRFHVNMEGSRILTNYDIFVAAGGAMRPASHIVTVDVTDGMLNIDFLTGAADLPRVSAIEVIRTNYALKPVADSYIRDGTYSNVNFGDVTMLDIKNNASDLSAKRSSYLRFQLPPAAAVTSAKLRIYGHNHENTKSISVHAYGVNNDTWAENGIVKNNAPTASTASLGYVAVNDAYKYYEIDVTSYVKAQQQSGETLVSLLLADPNNRNTRVVFNSKESSSNPPQLIVQTSPVVTSNTRLNQEEISLSSEAEPEPSSVYPNPVRKQFSVQVSSKHSEDISFDLLNSSGQSYQLVAAQKATAGQKAEVDISGLSLNSGIYLLKIQSAAATEVIKLLVTQ